MKEYKVIRFNLKMDYKNGKAQDGVAEFEKELNELAKEGYRLIRIADEYESMIIRKAAVLERDVD